MLTTPETKKILPVKGDRVVGTDSGISHLGFVTSSCACAEFSAIVRSQANIMVVVGTESSIRVNCRHIIHISCSAHGVQ